MRPHPIDPVALVAGLLFSLAGLAVIADRAWDDVDVTVLTGAGVAFVGVVLATVIVVRQLTRPDRNGEPGSGGDVRADPDDRFTP